MIAMLCIYLTWHSQPSWKTKLNQTMKKIKVTWKDWLCNTNSYRMTNPWPMYVVTWAKALSLHFKEYSTTLDEQHRTMSVHTSVPSAVLAWTCVIIASTSFVSPLTVSCTVWFFSKCLLSFLHANQSTSSRLTEQKSYGVTPNPLKGTTWSGSQAKTGMYDVCDFSDDYLQHRSPVNKCHICWQKQNAKTDLKFVQQPCDYRHLDANSLVHA